MHELSIAESIIDIVLDNAKSNDAKKVIKVTVVVGNCSGVVAESLRFCFDVIKKETVADDAELVITEVSASAHCETCGGDFKVGQYDYVCPKCGDIIMPMGGKELHISDMEVE